MDKTKDKIEEYIKLLKKEIDIEMVILFGSYLSDKFNEKDSDIDMLIVSKDFEKIDKLKAYKILSRPLWEIDVNIDPISATVEEIERNERGTFLSEIIRTGKIIYKKTA